MAAASSTLPAVQFYVFNGTDDANAQFVFSIMSISVSLTPIEFTYSRWLDTFHIQRVFNLFNININLSVLFLLNNNIMRQTIDGVLRLSSALQTELMLINRFDMINQSFMVDLNVQQSWIDYNFIFNKPVTYSLACVVDTRNSITISVPEFYFIGH